MVGHSPRRAASRARAIAATADLNRRRAVIVLAMLTFGAIVFGATGQVRGAGMNGGQVELAMAEPVAVLQPGIVLIPPLGDTREVDVYFAWDRSVLQDKGRRQVWEFAQRLLSWGGGVRMTVVGHADRSGSDAYNMALSQRRAIAVREELLAQGVTPGVVGVEWKGERQPAVATADGVRLAENRRTFIRLELDASQQNAMASGGWQAFQDHDYEAALAAWQPLANRELPAAMTYVGYFHENGLGVDADLAKAVDYYRKAAAKGDRTASNRLGVMLATGRGVQQDHAEAVKLFRAAARAGHPIAHLNLGIMQEHGMGTPADEAAAIRSYAAAVDAGELRAATNLGNIALERPDYMLNGRSAAEWFKLAAMHGDAVAQNNLGVMHALGRNVHRNHTQALAWFEMAAAVMPVEAYAEDLWTDTIARASLMRFYRTARDNRDAMRGILSARQKREALDLAGQWTRSMAALR